MSGDKRSVSTDALETLGTILVGDGHGRDAIHLAVEPVVAGQRLRPGKDVGFLADGRVGETDNNVGIVDPFLTSTVEVGQRFWLVVYPRKITSLRHVWSHPEFPESDTPARPARLSYNGDELWIREFAHRVGLDYTVIMDGADAWVASRLNGTYGEYLCFGGLLEGEYVPDEFWSHYEAVRGIKVEEEHRGSFFTCSC